MKNKKITESQFKTYIISEVKRIVKTEMNEEHFFDYENDSDDQSKEYGKDGVLGDKEFDYTEITSFEDLDNYPILKRTDLGDEDYFNRYILKNDLYVFESTKGGDNYAVSVKKDGEFNQGVKFKDGRVINNINKLNELPENIVLKYYHLFNLI